MGLEGSKIEWIRGRGKKFTEWKFSHHLDALSGDLRHNPDPICGTSIPQFAFVFVMLHEGFACCVMVDDGDVVLLIRVQNCNINLDESLILPQ